MRRLSWFMPTENKSRTPQIRALRMRGLSSAGFSGGRPDYSAFALRKSTDYFSEAISAKRLTPSSPMALRRSSGFWPLRAA